MLQGQDPFDDYRSKRKVEQLESDFRTEAERKRARMRQLLGREEDDEEKVRRRVEAEMEDFFQAPEDDDQVADDELEPEVASGPSSEIRDQIDAVLGSDEDDDWEEVEDDAPAGDGTRPYDELQAALDRLRRGAESPAEPAPPAPARKRRKQRPVEAPAPESTVSSLDDLDPPDWLDLTEERIGEARPAAVSSNERTTDDFEFGRALHNGPITRARPGVIDPFATPQSVPHVSPEPPASPRPVAPPAPAPVVAEPAAPAPTPAPAPAPRPSMAELAAEARMSELERRVAKLESMLERLSAKQS